MSSPMYKPTIDATPQPVQPRVPAPAFAPQFRRSVVEHPLLTGVVAAVVTLLLLAYALRMHPMYSAESLVYIEPLSNKVLADATSNSFDSTRYESLIQQEMQTAQRMDIMQAALANLPQSTRSEFGSNAAIAAQNLQNQLKVQRVTTSYQVSISLKGLDPVKTAAIVNAVTAAFLQAGRKDQLTDADQRSQLLAEERQRIERELTQTRAEQTQLSAQLGIANPTGVGSNPFDTQLDNLRSQLTTARTNHDIAAAQLASLSGSAASHTSGLTAAANDAIASDTGLSSMRATINQRRATLSSQMAGLMPANPVYKADQDELADLDKTLETMTQQMRDKAAHALQDKLRSDLERTGDVAGRLNSEVAVQTAHATGAAPRLQRASDLAAEVLRLQTRFAAVDNALHSLQLDTTGPGMVHLALAASVPTGPEPNRKRLVELAALPVGLLFGLSAAVFARKRDQHIYTAGDLDEALGFAPIAILPAQEEVSDAVLQEYYLRLAAGLEGAYRSSGARTFLLTAVSGSTEIATLVQELDRKLGRLGLGVVVAQTGQLIASDEEAGHATTGYDRRFEGFAPSMLERMKTDHDVVLLEAPALLYSAQAEYVARCADVTVLVAESGVTTRRELLRCSALLQRLNVTGVGAVLDALRMRHADEGLRRAAAELDRRVPAGQAFTRRVETVPEAPPQAGAFSEPVVTEVLPVPVAIEHTPQPEIVTETLHEDENPPVAAMMQAVASEREGAPPPPVVAAIQPQVVPAPRFAFHPETPKAEASTMNKSWLQRLFGRDTETVYSIIPDAPEEDYEEAYEAVEPAHGLRLASPVARQEEPLDIVPRMAEPQFVAPPVPQDTVGVAPVVEVAPPPPIPAAQLFVEPSPQAPVPVVQAIEPVRSVRVKPLSFAELSQLSQPEAATRVAEAAIVPMHEPLVEVPTERTVAAVELQPEPVSEAMAVLPPPPAEVAEEMVPMAQEPVPAEAIEAEPAVLPEPVAAEAAAAVAPETVMEADPEPPLAPEPVIEEWVPAPLNRWDPIPPLRADGAWRSRQFKIPAARPADPVWAQQDPMHIPATDRWGASEAAYPAEVAAETPDIVLTRRWGLLSRFQQGERFNTEQREGDPEAVAANPAYRSGDHRS